MNGTYLIAEIGQNHNGSVWQAMELIRTAAMPVWHGGKELPGINAVKLTIRDLEHELSPESWYRPYDGPHSFGRTYGEHRKKLELSLTDHERLYHYAKGWSLDFVETVCNPGALRVLDFFQPDSFKIASRDIRNIPLLEAVGETGVPVIFSTGFANSEDDITEAYQLLSSRGQPVSVLHCVSKYPAPYEELNLRRMGWLRKILPDAAVGFSDHTTGVLAPALAVAMGADLIEKHVTLDKSLPGSDQAGSMDVGGMWRVVRDVRNAEAALGDWFSHTPDKATWKKLGRSLAVSRDIPEDEQISESDLIMVSPGTGHEWKDRHEFVGKRTGRNLAKNTILQRLDVR